VPTAKHLKPLTEDDLNFAVVGKKGRAWAIGMLDMANLVNEMYSNSTVHLNAIGDCGVRHSR